MWNHFVAHHINTWSARTIYGERVSRKMRRAVFSSLLEQEIGYYDQAKTGDLISKISGDIDTISAGVSDKLGIVRTISDW